ncbi:MAG: hypothetical protein J7M38_06130, partial [Armatimonadetes bacterium]|nr:hypothetical protein [Armatimonadota bacterium]
GDEVDEGYAFLPAHARGGAPNNDGYLAARLAWRRPGLQIGANTLVSGISQPNAIAYSGPNRGRPHPGLVNDETAMSVDIAAEIWGHDLRAEYAVIAEHANRPTMPDRPGAPISARRPSALVASVDLLRTRQFALSGFFSTADPGYDIYYSAINPYYEVLYTGGTPGTFIPFERWLRRPLVMPNVRVIGGRLVFEAARGGLEIVYYALDDNAGPRNWWNPYNPNMGPAGSGYDLTGLNYDQLYAFKASYQATDGVDIEFTYAHQEADAVGFEDLDLLQAAVAVGF